MQGIASEINKMKRSSLLFSASLNSLRLIYFVGAQLLKDVRNWISPPDPSKNYNIACETYQTGTSVWFFRDGVFSEWSSKGSVLWIHGKRARLINCRVLGTDLILMSKRVQEKLFSCMSSLVLSFDVAQSTPPAPRLFGTSIASAQVD